MTRRSTTLLSASLLLLVACGARTGLDAGDYAASGGSAGSVGQGGSGVGPIGQGGGASGHAGNAHAGATGAGGNTPVKFDCTDASITYIYAIAESGVMYSFDPAAGSVTPLHKVVCPTTGTPFSMAVDRKGVAYVVYSDQQGSVFRVSTATGACTVLPYQPGQSSFTQFGMGFSTNLGGPSETLFLATDGAVAMPHLGSLDLTTFKVTDIAPVPGGITGVELTGTGDGRLYGFFQDQIDSTLAHIVHIDKKTSAFSGISSLPGVNLGDGWAFGFWGGDFFLFTHPNVGPQPGSGLITRVDPTTGATSLAAVIPNGDFIVGAGVSTCAPEE